MKTIAITGGTSGIGYACVRHFYDAGWRIFLLARSSKKAVAIQKEFSDQLTVITCDLLELKSVQKASLELMKQTDRLDVLMNNAGAWFMQKQFTQDGHEKTFGLNHLGHFLLTTRLIPLLKASKTRVICVTSIAHRDGKLEFNDMGWSRRNYHVYKAYGASKLANILFAKELVRRYGANGISAYSVHPGVVATNFGNTNKGIFSWIYSLGKLFMISPEQGAKTQIMLATDPHIERFSGEYFSKMKVRKPAAIAKNLALAEQLWAYSEQCIRII